MAGSPQQPHDGARRQIDQQIETGTDSIPDRSADAPVVLSVDAVTKQFGTEQALAGLSVRVRQGELLTLLGPSGCGKTTTLRTIAGLERPQTGTVTINETIVAGSGTFVPPEQRDVGLVFQEFALFPHLTAGENVAFGLDEWPRAERAKRVKEVFDLVGLSTQRDAYPDTLSGGQKQRIALARALAPRPELLLLDEPFSNLDRELRLEMREELRRIVTETDVTAVFVTHNQAEALSISDRLAVVHDGMIEQVGTPEAVFQHPTSRFVAEFMGDAGFLTGQITATGVRTPLGALSFEQLRGTLPDVAQGPIDILVRPDDLTAQPASPAAADGTVVYRKYLGSLIQYRVELADGTIVECLHDHTADLTLGSPVTVELTADHPLSWFPP